jgi:hypothetical protein
MKIEALCNRMAGEGGEGEWVEGDINKNVNNLYIKVNE